MLHIESAWKYKCRDCEFEGTHPTQDVAIDVVETHIMEETPKGEHSNISHVVEFWRIDEVSFDRW